MNTPNKLTLVRICMIPLFVAFMLLGQIPHNFLWAFLTFMVASLTDLLDGHLARKNNLITDFGKFMDPLADKLLVTSALICFVGLGFAPAVVIIIILSREFLVTSLRLVAAGSGKVIAAGIWGKLKTVFQMVWVCYVLVYQWLKTSIAPQWLTDLGKVPDGINWAFIAIVTILTVYSGANYLWVNRHFVDTTK